jgi:forkhead box protein K
VLHENQLILNPTIFSHLTPEQLRELEALGAQKALEILQGHIVRFLKERIKTEGRARGGRGRVKRARGSAPGAQTEKQDKSHPGTALFTTTPLPLRNAPPPMDALLPTPSPSGGSDEQVDAETGPSSPIVVVDDDEPSDGPVHKRRRLGMGGVPATPVAV